MRICERRLQRFIESGSGRTLWVMALWMGLWSCGGDLDVVSATSSKAQVVETPPEVYQDALGRKWLRSATPVVYEEAPSKRYEVGESVREFDLSKMSLEEVTAALRPKSLRGDWEYTLADEDAIEFAREILVVEEEQRTDVPEEGLPGARAVGSETEDPGEVAEPSAPNVIVGSDDRYSIEYVK